jgi:hypothetical protein
MRCRIATTTAMEVLKANALDFARRIDELRSILVVVPTKKGRSSLANYLEELIGRRTSEQHSAYYIVLSIFAPSASINKHGL